MSRNEHLVVAIENRVRQAVYAETRDQKVANNAAKFVAGQCRADIDEAIGERATQLAMGYLTDHGQVCVSREDLEELVNAIDPVVTPRQAEAYHCVRRLLARTEVRQ